MKEASKDVYMKVNDVRTKVGTATVQFAETMEEAVEIHGGAEEALKLLNSQYLTNEMNRIRGEARGGPGKKVIESRALALITDDEWANVAGDPDAIQSLLEQKRTEVKETIESERNAQLAAANTGSDDGEDDDDDDEDDE